MLISAINQAHNDVSEQPFQDEKAYLILKYAKKGKWKCQ
jgi:hypothetical protein